MAVLGVNGLNGTYHDSGACLILDSGEWIAAEEERFTRVKHASGIPANAIAWCLREGNVRADQLAAVGFFLDLPTHAARYFLKPVYDNPGAADNAFLHSYKLFQYWSRGLLGDLARWLGVPPARVVGVPHHLCHAASAYYLSPFEDAAILTVDGAGDAESACYWAGRGSSIERVATPMVFPQSIGLLYNFAADYLGLGAAGSAGKLMGLAPYGKPVHLEKLRQIVRIPRIMDARAVIGIDMSFFAYQFGTSPWYADKFERLVGPPRRRGDPILQEHADFAASMQALLEEAVVFWARQLQLLTDARRFCYAGGVALNIDANSRIRAETSFEEVYITPSAYDAGTSIGAALHLHHRDASATRVRPMAAAYKGPQFGDDDIEAAMREAGVSYERSANPVEAAADLLARGAVVGWFQGREEIGPRALGNRSILMDPGLPDGKARINSQVKFREAFRPFAPSVPLDAASRYFVDPCPSPFMLYTFQVRPEWRDRLAAVTHVDGSARVHTVARDENPLFHSLLEAFGRRRGYAVLLNTSFNVQGQPLVSTPTQAIDVFRHSDIDAIVIGPFVLTRTARPRRDVQAPPLADGMIDPGTAPEFGRFEHPLPSPDYPSGVEITNEEHAVLSQYLAALREAAERDEELTALAQRIEALEGDLEAQRTAGADELPRLWRAFAERWHSCVPPIDDQLRPVVDRHLLGDEPFPGLPVKPLPLSR